MKKKHKRFRDGSDRFAAATVELCWARYTLEIEQGSPSELHSADTYNFRNIFLSSFSLFGTGNFVWYSPDHSGNYYLSEGRCEQISKELD